MPPIVKIQARLAELIEKRPKRATVNIERTLRNTVCAGAFDPSSVFATAAGLIIPQDADAFFIMLSAHSRTLDD